MEYVLGFFRTRRRLACVIVLTIGFAVSRLAYVYHGNEFDLSGWMWQILDFDLLQTRLAQSIFYLHSQPPLPNLFLGIVLKATDGDPAGAAQFIQWCFALMGFVLTLIVFQLMVDLGASIFIALLLTLLFEFNPGTITLENWFYSTYPTEFLLCVSAFFLNRFLRGQNRYGPLFLICTALPVLINSSFQPIWFVCVLAFSYYCIREQMREMFTPTLVILGIVAILPIKNALVFQTFTTSSWFGMNLARVTTFQIPKNVRDDEITEGNLSQYASIAPFSDLNSYPPAFEEPTDIPVLDRETKADGSPNFNNLLYVDISGHYLHDAIQSVIYHRGAYLNGIVRAAGCYLGPLKDQHQFHRRSLRLGAWNSAYDLILQPSKALWWRRHHDLPTMSLTLLIGLPTICLLASIRLARRGAWKPSEVTIAFLLMTIAYTTATGVLFEVGENFRFRAVIDPLLLVLAGVFVAGTTRAAITPDTSADLEVVERESVPAVTPRQ